MNKNMDERLDKAVALLNQGRLLREDFIKRLRRQSPKLSSHIEGNRIRLGELPMDERLTWANTKGFWINAINYALVREDIRAELRPPGKTRKGR